MYTTHPVTTNDTNDRFYIKKDIDLEYYAKRLGILSLVIYLITHLSCWYSSRPLLKTASEYMDEHVYVQYILSIDLFIHSIASTFQLLTVSTEQLKDHWANALKHMCAYIKDPDQKNIYKTIVYIQQAYIMFAYGALIFPVSTYYKWHMFWILSAVLLAFLSSLFSCSRLTILLIISIILYFSIDKYNTPAGPKAAAGIAEIFYFSTILLRSYWDVNPGHNCMITVENLKKK